MTSAKFGQYTGCVLEEIEKAIAAESALVAPAAGDSTGDPDAAASPADEAIESPAAMRVRLQTGRRITSYRQGRISPKAHGPEARPLVEFGAVREVRG